MSSPTKCSTTLGKLWRRYCYCLGICGYEHHSSCTAVGLLWSTLAHTSLDGHSNILILLNMHSMQWQILIPRSRIAEGYTAWPYTILLNPTSKPGVATASVNLKSSVRQVCLRWDIKMDAVTICNMWYCFLKILLSKGEHCNNDLAYFHCCL